MVAVIGAICKHCNVLLAFDDEDVLKRERPFFTYDAADLCDQHYIVCDNCKADVHIKYDNFRAMPRYVPPDNSPLPDPISVPSKEELTMPIL